MARFMMCLYRCLLLALALTALQLGPVMAVNRVAMVPKKVTWGRLVSAEPHVVDLMAYCRAINLDRTGCAIKFIGDTGPPTDIAAKASITKRILEFVTRTFSSSSGIPRFSSFMSGTVALEAAGICVHRQKLMDTRLSNMFNIDFVKMREVAGGFHSFKSHAGWYIDKEGRLFRLTYTTDVRELAAKRAKDSFWKQIHDKREAQWKLEDWIRENSMAYKFTTLETKWGPAIGPGDANGDKYVRLGEIIVDLIHYGSAKDDRATAAYNSPASMGYKEDLICYPNHPMCIDLFTGAEVPPPEGPFANDYEAPPEPKAPKVDWSFPDHVDEHAFDPDLGPHIPIPDSDSEPEPVKAPTIKMDVDFEVKGFDPNDTTDDDNAGIDEDNSTPVLPDADARTALQQCQEEQERKIWHENVITHKNPDAPTDEEQKGAAEQMLGLGVCDKTYYGAAYCQAWRIERDSVPVDPELLASLYDVATRNPMCPINLISPEDCARQIELLHYQLDCTQFFDSVLGTVWATPSPPAAERLDFGPPRSDSPGRFVPLTEEEWLGDDWSAVGLPPMKPRIVGGKDAYEAIVAMNMKFPTGNDLLSAWIPAAGQPPIIPNTLAPSDWTVNIPVGRLPGTTSSGHLGGLGSGWRPLGPLPSLPVPHGEL